MYKSSQKMQFTFSVTGATVSALIGALIGGNIGSAVNLNPMGGNRGVSGPGLVIGALLGGLAGYGLGRLLF